eukprot:TRINITY_DN44770_c0_g1_i1.p1 TRINITY_DN44770_c0_g1~~TRINITY_DN44770_c0_g1_i1.p1  ORF type:complete len:427 (-),score=112.49 TRINITY_DN44770_c0_g1_i1:234-1514(-)
MLPFMVLGGIIGLLKMQGVSWFGVVAILLTFVVLFVGNLLVSQESILYIPEPVRGMKEPRDNPEGMRSPKEKGIAYKDIWLKTEDDVKIHAWFLSCNAEPVEIELANLDMSAESGDAPDLGLQFADEDELEKQAKWLRIKSVSSGGLIDKWNLRNPSKAVRTGDRIFELNGKRFETALQVSEALKQERSKDVTIKVYADRTPTYMFCHENAGNIGLRLSNFEKMIEELKVNILAFDYRGYGYSDGTPSEQGLIEDALAAWRWLQGASDAGALDGQQLFVNGRSLGGAVAVGMVKALTDAGEPLPRGIILENTFISIAALLDSVFPFLAFDIIKKYLLRLRWETIDRIRHVKVPLLFLSAEQDEIIPCWHMEALRKAATEAAFVAAAVFQEGGHNDMWEKGGQKYWKSHVDFVRRCTSNDAIEKKAD